MCIYINIYVHSSVVSGSSLKMRNESVTVSSSVYCMVAGGSYLAVCMYVVHEILISKCLRFNSYISALWKLVLKHSQNLGKFL